MTNSNIFKEDETEDNYLILKHGSNCRIDVGI